MRDASAGTLGEGMTPPLMVSTVQLLDSTGDWKMRDATLQRLTAIEERVESLEIALTTLVFTEAFVATDAGRDSLAFLASLGLETDLTPGRLDPTDQRRERVLRGAQTLFLRALPAQPPGPESD